MGISLQDALRRVQAVEAAEPPQPLPEWWCRVNENREAWHFPVVENDIKYVGEEVPPFNPRVLVVATESGSWHPQHFYLDPKMGVVTDDKIRLDASLFYAGLQAGDQIMGYVEGGPDWAEMAATKRGYRQFHIADIFRYGGMDVTGCMQAERRMMIEEVYAKLEELYKLEAKKSGRYEFPYALTREIRSGFYEAWRRCLKHGQTFLLKKQDVEHWWVQVK